MGTYNLNSLPVAPTSRKQTKKYCEAFVYKAGFTLTQDSPGVVCRPALLTKTAENVEYDKLLEVALAVRGDKYFGIMQPVLGSRYHVMCREWSNLGDGAYLGGASAVYLGLGITATLHVDDRDVRRGPEADCGACTVFARFGIMMRTDERRSQSLAEQFRAVAFGV